MRRKHSVRRASSDWPRNWPPAESFWLRKSHEAGDIHKQLHPTRKRAARAHRGPFPQIFRASSQNRPPRSSLVSRAGGELPAVTRKETSAMTRAALAIGVGLLAVAGIAAARHDEDAESVKPVAAYDIVEKLDGKDTTASVVEVTIEPGKAGVAHRHPGPGFGYVLEGQC